MPIVTYISAGQTIFFKTIALKKYIVSVPFNVIFFDSINTQKTKHTCIYSTYILKFALYNLKCIFVIDLFLEVFYLLNADFEFNRQCFYRSTKYTFSDVDGI